MFIRVLSRVMFSVGLWLVIRSKMELNRFKSTKWTTVRWRIGNGLVQLAAFISKICGDEEVVVAVRLMFELLALFAVASVAAIVVGKNNYFAGGIALSVGIVAIFQCLVVIALDFGVFDYLEI